MPVPELKDIINCSELLEIFVPPENLDSFRRLAPTFLCSMDKLDPSHRELGLFKVSWIVRVTCQ